MATSASPAAAALAGLAVAKTAPSGRWGSSASFRRHRSSAGVRCNAGPARLKISANLGQLWEAAKGAPPAAVLAAAAAVAVVYKVASGFLAPPPPRRREQPVTEAPPPPPPPPVMVGELTEEELRQYDGSDPEKPLLMAIKGNIYDVSQSRMFYGPSGPYALFAGKDASRALAKMSFEPQDLTGDISGLGPFELSALQDWEYKFMGKYTQVGTIKKTAPVGDGTVCSSSEIEDKAVGGNPNEKKAPEILGVLSSMDTKEKEGNAEEGVGETKN